MYEKQNIPLYRVYINDDGDDDDDDDDDHHHHHHHSDKALFSNQSYIH